MSTRRQPDQSAFVRRLPERPPRFLPSEEKGSTVQPITDKRLAQVRRECVAFAHIPSSDVQRVLARLDAAERENTLLRRQQGATEGALSLGGENEDALVE